MLGSCFVQEMDRFYLSYIYTVSETNSVTVTNQVHSIPSVKQCLQSHRRGNTEASYYQPLLQPLVLKLKHVNENDDDKATSTH